MKEDKINIRLAEAQLENTGKKEQYRIVRQNGRYSLEKKGWFFWKDVLYPCIFKNSWTFKFTASIYTFETEEEVIDFHLNHRQIHSEEYRGYSIKKYLKWFDNHTIDYCYIAFDGEKVLGEGRKPTPDYKFSDDYAFSEYERKIRVKIDNYIQKQEKEVEQQEANKIKVIKKFEL